MDVAREADHGHPGRAECESVGLESLGLAAEVDSVHPDAIVVVLWSGIEQNRVVHAIEY